MSFDTKKHRFGVFLVQLWRIVFSVFTGQIHSFFGYSPPVSVGVGSEIGQICGVFSSKDSKMHIFLTFLNGYIHPNNFKNKKQAWGFAPNPTHLRGRRGRWQTLSTYPYGECWVDSKASRVKCTTSSPLTPLHLRGVAKLTEADGAGNPSRLAKQPRSGLAFTGWRRPNASVVRVQEVFPCTPATWRTRVWAAPTVLARPLGVAQ